MNPAQPPSLLKNLQSSISHCLSSYANYISLLEQNQLSKEYGWHNRIWTIHDIEAPVNITNLITHLELERKLFFAALGNGVIRLTDALYSININGNIWDNALYKTESYADTHVYIFQMISAAEELNHAVQRLKME